MNRPLIGLLSLLPFAMLGAAACGGSSFDSGGLGVGGTGATAGSSSSGGHAAGGATGTAGSSSIAGSSNAGATSNGGTGNVAGAGGGVDIEACTSNSDCEVVAAGCCSCGQGPVSNFTAINSKYSDQYEQRCGDVACAACPPTVQNPNEPTLYYVATCQANRCVVVDLETTDITQCTTASDCSLRSGTNCCPGCGGQPVSLNTSNEPELSKLVCGTAPIACAECVDQFSGYSPGCSEGRCSVVLTPCTPDQPCPL
jgi:hypothetical protein